MELGPGAELVRDVRCQLMHLSHEGDNQVHICGDAPLVVEARLGELRRHGGLPLAVPEVGVVVALEGVGVDQVGGLVRAAARDQHQKHSCDTNADDQIIVIGSNAPNILNQKYIIIERRHL